MYSPTTRSRMKKALLILIVSLAIFPAMAQKNTKMPNDMIQHVVLFKFKPEITPAKLKELEESFAALPSQIKEIVGFQWGLNNSPEKHDKGFTHGYILTFKTEKDRDAYLPHPAHVAFGAKVGPWLADITVLDFKNQYKP